MNFGIKNRIKELDIIRGLLIVLMMIDHFFLLYLNLSNYINNTNISLYSIASFYLSNDIRKCVRFVVMSVFFIISGICCIFSRNSVKRTIKLCIASFIFSVSTYLVSIIFKFNCFVLCGVLFCYSIYNFIFCILQGYFEKKSISINFILVLMLLATLFCVFDFKIEGTNVFMFLGLPDALYIAPFEYVSPPKFMWAFFTGVFLGQKLYSNHMFSYFDYNIPILSWIGKNGIYFYFLHYPFLILFIYIITILF